MAQSLRMLLMLVVGGVTWLVAPVLEAAVDYSSNAGASIGRVRTGEHSGYSRIVLDSTKRINFKYDTSPDGRTIAVELPKVKWNGKESYIYKKSKNIDRIEYVPSSAGGGTVLIEGKSPVGLRWVRMLSPSGKRGNRLVLDVAPRASTTLPPAGMFENNVVRDKASGQVVSAPPVPLSKHQKAAMAGGGASQKSMANDQVNWNAQKAQAQGGGHVGAHVGGHGGHGGNVVILRPKAYVAMKGGVFFGSSGGFDLEDSAASHSTDTDPVIVGGWLGAALGLDWADIGVPIRNELEFSYRFKTKNDIEAKNQTTGVSQSGNMEVESQNYMLNTYYDISVGGLFSPYIGVGFGLARNVVEVDTTLGGVAQSFGNDEQINFAWSLNAGAAYRVTPNWALDFGYRYISLGEIKTADGTGANAGRRFEHGTLKSHDLSLGVRYSF